MERSWWHDGLMAVRLAGRFVVATVAGRLVAATVIFCAAVSFLELGVTYRTKAFAGAALAVTASEWWLLLPLAAAAVWLCVSMLAFSGRGARSLAADELARERELTPLV